MTKIVCVIQARTGSTRLPSKILKKIQGKELLLHVVDRVLDSKLIDIVVVATTIAKPDDLIVELINNYDKRVHYYRGSEQDVLDRYYQTAKKFAADIVIRVTSDCPLIDSEIIDEIIKEFMNSDFDYISNNIGRRTYPRGLDAEVFSFKALKRAWHEGDSASDREHVTWYIRQHPHEFKTMCHENDVDLSKNRWTVDEQADLDFVNEVYKRLYNKNKKFKTKEILELLTKEPSLVEINSHIEQKKVDGKEA